MTGQPVAAVHDESSDHRGQDPPAVRVVLVSGSTRDRSTCTAALRTVERVAPADVVATLWRGLTEVPAFVPDSDDADGGAELGALRRSIAEADAVLFCTPEYAGTLPGSLKNVLDWLVGTGELYGKPVAWTTVAAPGRGSGAEAALASVLRYVGAVIVEPAVVRVPVARTAVGADGLVDDAGIRADLAAQLGAFAAAVRGQRGSAGVAPGLPSPMSS